MNRKQGTSSTGRVVRAALIAALALLAALSAFSGMLGPAAEQAGPSQDDAAKLTGLIKADAFLEAARLADGLLARGPLAPETEAICGLAVLLAGRVDAAEAVLKRVEAKSPGLFDTAFGLGLIARIHNDPEAAVARLRRGSASAGLYEEACRRLWRTVLERGVMTEIKATRDLVAERFKLEGLSAPDWLSGGLAQLEGLAGSGLFQMDKAPDHIAVPLLSGEGPTLRMVSMRINGMGPYRFDIDSAAADFLIVSPLLAEELGLKPTGSSQAIGVGSGSAPVRFARLDRAELGGITFRNIPVRVADTATFRGLKKGLLGTGLLKRFNVTIDVRAGVMDLFALAWPELLAARIDKAAVAVEVPLLLFDATMVTASIAGAPEGLYILDTAAATHLIDAPFFGEHVKPRLDPSRIITAGIRGAQGVQSVNQVNGLEIRLGPLRLVNQQVNEFAMSALNGAAGRYAAGLLGNPILWPYRSHYDFKNGKLILERYK